MNIRPKIRNAALVGALAAVTATAWATSESLSDSTYVAPTPIAVESPAATVAVPVSDSLAPTEVVVITPDAAPTRVVEPGYAQPPIVVEARRLSEDERIQAVVMDRIATMPNISGKVSVQSHDSVVQLSGYTTTAGQAYRVGREAGKVTGVKYVQNEIRSRIGGSV
jgi:hypothetical protein